jgi:hypothetical protein
MRLVDGCEGALSPSSAPRRRQARRPTSFWDFSRTMSARLPIPNPQLRNRFSRKSRLLSPRAPQSGRAQAALFESLLLRHHVGLPVQADPQWPLRVCGSVSAEPERGLTRCLDITLHWSGAAHTAFPGGDLPGPDPVRQWRPATIFRRRAAAARLCIAKQNSRPPPSSAALRPCRQAGAGAGRIRPRQGDRREGRDGRGQTSNRSFP